MSVDISVRPIIGWRLDRDDFDATVGTVIPAVTHTEPRFDPLTGHRVANATIVDQPERRVINLPSGKQETYHDVYENEDSLRDIFKDTGVIIEIDGTDGDWSVYLGIDVETDKKETLGGMLHIRESCEIPADVIQRLQAAEDVIKNAINIDVCIDEARIWIAWGCSY